jgi:hypothetical protein
MGLAAYEIIGDDAEWRVRHDGKAENVYGVMKDLTGDYAGGLWARFAQSDRCNRLRAVSTHSKSRAFGIDRRTRRMILTLVHEALRNQCPGWVELRRTRCEQMSSG